MAPRVISICHCMSRVQRDIVPSLHTKLQRRHVLKSVMSPLARPKVLVWSYTKAYPLSEGRMRSR